MGRSEILFLALSIPQHMEMNDTQPRCGVAWKTSQEYFKNALFGHIMITLYSFGVIFNSFNIVVFTKRNKISSSNVLFTSLAISDLTVSILGIPFWWCFFRPGTGSASDKSVAHYYIILLRLFFNISVLHTTTLAIWRFIAVTCPLKERRWCNLKNTFIAIIAVYMFCILYEVKTLFCYDNVAENILLKNNVPTSTRNYTSQGNITKEISSTIHNGTNGFFCTFPEYIYVVVIRILPSIIVITCSFRLIYVLQRSKKRRKELMPNLQNDLAKDMEKEKQMNRTSRMLLGIMILFLLDKVTGAVVKILIILYDFNFILDCLPAIVQIITILSLIYVSTPFVVYYISSQHFRNAFKSLFSTKKCITLSDEDVSIQMNTESTHL